MTFRDQLVKLEACPESIEWVKNKNIEEAWKTCKDAQWMLWVLSQTDLDLIDPVCDIAEGVLYLVPEDSKLACIWAISAARRRADQDELYASADAAYSASRYSATRSADYATYAAEGAAAYAARTARGTRASAVAASYSATCTAKSAAAAVSAAPAACASAITAYHEEQKNQCNIIRKYFTIDQVKEAFNKIVA